MKQVLVILLVMVFSVPSMAFTPESERDLKMLKIMKDFRVKSWGKREKQYALITCLIPKKQKVPGKICKIRVQHPEDPSYTNIYRIYKEDALAMAALLKEFNIESWGKKDRQDAEIECAYKRKSKVPVKICKVIDDSLIWP